MSNLIKECAMKQALVSAVSSQNTKQIQVNSVAAMEAAAVIQANNGAVKPVNKFMPADAKVAAETVIQAEKAATVTNIITTTKVAKATNDTKSKTYSYNNSSYGSFSNDDNVVALEVATILAGGNKKNSSYSYAGSSYGSFGGETGKTQSGLSYTGSSYGTFGDEKTEPKTHKENNNVVKQSFFAKYKYIILTVVTIIAGYFVFRKK